MPEACSQADQLKQLAQWKDYVSPSPYTVSLPNNYITIEATVIDTYLEPNSQAPEKYFELWNF